MNESTEHKLRRLTDAWKLAKAQEQAFAATRITIESEIYELKRAEIPEKGTVTFDGGMKVATGYSEDWDQEKLNEAYEQWPVGAVKFPFTGQWKADGKAISYLRENAPELYQIILGALTLKARKPAFSVITDK